MARQWDTNLDISMLTIFTDMASIPQRQNIAPIIVWEAAVSILDQWEVLLEVILGTLGGNPAVYEI